MGQFTMKTSFAFSDGVNDEILHFLLTTAVQAVVRSTASWK